MADKSAYVPADAAASGGGAGKSELDLNIDGDFFGSKAPKPPNVPSSAPGADSKKSNK